MLVAVKITLYILCCRLRFRGYAATLFSHGFIWAVAGLASEWIFPSLVSLYEGSPMIWYGRGKWYIKNIPCIFTVHNLSFC